MNDGSTNLHAVILAGGSGTRFWPASRTDRPKQLLPLAQGRTLLEATIDRVRGLVREDRVWVVTNPAQLANLRACIPEFPANRILVEPEPRDTAACVALAIAHLEAADPGAVIAVLPADHVIEPAERFRELLDRGAQLAREGRMLVTFGIRPTRPATSFGYIEPGDLLRGGTGARSVVRFREKPDLETARQYVASGRFLWNSGIFVWTAASLLDAMAVGNAELEQRARDMMDAVRRGDRPTADAIFRRMPKTSIDYAVMERAPRVAVLEADVAWSDLGSFLALGSVVTPDPEGNVCVLAGGAGATLVGSENCIVYAEGPRTVALLGTHDLVCVLVHDAVLVCPRDRADDLKRLVQKLREQKRDDLL
jgi:mannose-1-phosphate guanylyltransferase